MLYIDCVYKQKIIIPDWINIYYCTSESRIWLDIARVGQKYIYFYKPKVNKNTVGGHMAYLI